MKAPQSAQLPRATYRLQLHKDFTFDDAIEVLPYIADLGVSHLYLSPIMAARPGSTHGYDVIDHNRVNPELGGEEGFDRLCAKAQSLGLGIILDLVPNHVGVGADNAAWMEMLEWGQRSAKAGMFDVDWNSSRRNLQGKVLLPVLGAPFGIVLEQGELTLRLDAQAGQIDAWYYETRLPVSPLDYLVLLEPSLKRYTGEHARELANLVRDFEALSTHQGSDQSLIDTARGLKSRLAEALRIDAELAAAIASTLDEFSKNWRALGDLLDRQAYRAAYWRVSADEINYRRFFDINDLAGLRVEREALFASMHERVFEFVAQGKVQGLRIDHVDGLLDPREYAERLQAAAGKPDAPIYIVIEKILAPHESLPEAWPVAGTTGYDTLNLVGGLFIDPESERALSLLYRRYTGRDEDFDSLLVRSKLQILQESLASEVGVLANAVQTLSASDWHSRDFTYAGIRRALESLIAHFPVYRPYLDRRLAPSAADLRVIDWAVGRAKKAAGAVDTSVFDFLGKLLKGELCAPDSGYDAELALRAAQRFQQLSGPAMAKGLEDTSFYRHFRLLAHNEVGGDPRRYAVTVSAFHRANEDRLRKFPADMLGATTHDTKRGEDARMRIAALSGMTAEWGRRVSAWTRANRRWVGEHEGEAAPDRNHQYYFYQTLVGAWPMELRVDDVDGAAALAERVIEAMLKAVREGKERSSWTNQVAAYEDAVRSFVRGALDASKPNAFLLDFAEFMQRVGALGALNSLSQTLLRLTMPGVPDLYQGSESWQLSMVDPDNRRPVDYARLREQLAELRKESNPAALMQRWADGLPKLHLVQRVLELRRRKPLLFAAGAYRPLAAEGERADHLVAYAREDDSAQLLVLAPRLWPALQPDPAQPADWRDTQLMLPNGQYRDLLSDRVVNGGARNVSELLSAFPVALLLRA